MTIDDTDFVAKARAAAAEEEWQQAFGHLRWVFRDPDLPGDDRRFVESLELLASIGGAIAGDEFRDVARGAASSPDSPAALHALGYELCEHQLFEVAAGVLARAHRLAPGTEQIVAEWVHALECDGQSSAACAVLVEQPALLEKHNIFRYLLAFNSLMSGDLAKAREILPSLERHDDESVLLANRIEAMLGRADAVDGVCALDAHDLRGWHYVLNGGLLLHLSPFGFDEGMQGRYAFTQDSASRCRDAILRLQAALEVAGMTPKQVVSLADRDSQILGAAVAKILALKNVTWKSTGGLRRFLGPQEGLVVGYDLAGQPEKTLAELGKRHPGQHLFIHATCWTEPPPFCPDFTTYLYQVNVSPWGERTRFDAEAGSSRQLPPDDRPIAELADEIVSGQDEPEEAIAADSRAALMAAASAMLEKGDRSGTRPRMWQGGPVKSSRFG